MQSILHMRFENFKPQKEEKKALKLTREKLENRLPEGSVSNATIKKRNVGFEASVRIRTRKSIFNIRAQAENLLQLNTKIQSKLKAQIGKYKSLKLLRNRKRGRSKPSSSTEL